MSAKWIRSKQWDDQHIPSWAWPAKVVLRTLSGIPLAIVLLGLVGLYCTMASIPVGLIALAPTYGLYGATLLAVVLAGAAVPIAALRFAWRPSTPGRRAARFAVSVIAGLVLIPIAAVAWQVFLWPHLNYDPVTGSGVRLFASFVSEYESTTLRRMPWLEMSELEFYSWWPIRLILTLFVVNMIVATVRRIEFTLPHLGVLTVHTGIVTIAFGSMYYGALKQEGDTLLFAGEPASDGQPTPGMPQSGFYDNMRTVLWIRQEGQLWEQRPIWAPRYNDYNLNAAGDETALAKVGHHLTHGADGGRKIDHEVTAPGDDTHLDADLRLKVVGYASYAEPAKDFARAAPPRGQPARPVRFVDLLVSRGASGEGSRELRAPFYFLPTMPAHQLAQTDVFALEYTRGMSEQRRRDLTETLPENARHALVIEVPGEGPEPLYRGVVAAEPGEKIAAGGTGFTVEVVDLMPRPPFPIITPGYQGADSSVAIVRITPPGGEAYERWVYHRFPEISQDMLQGMTADGRQMRRAADESIRISYLDASKIQIYLDEPADGGDDTPIRAIIRRPGHREARIEQAIEPGGTLSEIVPGLNVVLGDRWAHAEEIERPAVVPEEQRANDDVGNHGKAMLAVEISTDEWKRIVWLPFTRYLSAGLGTERSFTLPDGRKLELAFGRLRYPFPGFMIQLMDFQMVAYDHRGAPRDYQSLVRVVPQQFSDVPVSPIQTAIERIAGPFQPFEHITKLNAPLQAPFMASEERTWTANTLGTLLSRLNPQQFKFSQAGWDAEGWRESQALVDRGELRRPYAQFTILGVGNNPGIHIIALGGIMMSIGIPWAFYIKPLMMQRRKRKLQAQVAAGTYRKPVRPTRMSASPAGVAT